MEINLQKVNSFGAGVYLTFGALLLQNIVLLPFLATGFAFPVVAVYAVKYVLLAVIVCLLLVTKHFYQILWADKFVLAVIAAVLLLAIIHGGGLGYMADELRFYLSPILFYLIG